MMSSRAKRCLVMASLLVVTSGVIADDKTPSREREALRRTQQQLQQAQQELLTVKEKLSVAERETEKNVKELQSLKSVTRSDNLKSLQLQTALTEIQSQSKQLSVEKAEFERKLLQTQEVLTRLQFEQNSERDQIRRLQAELTARTRSINNCESKNSELYKSGRDLIEQCQIQTIDAPNTARYPQTGMKRVAIENLLESYRDKLDDGKLLNTSGTP